MSKPRGIGVADKAYLNHRLSSASRGLLNMKFTDVSSSE